MLSQHGDTKILLYKELSEITRPVLFVLVGDVSFTDINWDYCTAVTNTSMKILKNLKHNFLIWVLRDLTRKGALLDLLLV